jgi:hypothetical protein
MWIFEALAFLLRGHQDALAVAPAAFLFIAWVLWLRHRPVVWSWRAAALIAGLTAGTLAIGVEIAVDVYWRWLNPLLHPGAAYCATVEWAGAATFIGTVGGLLFALIGSGRGRVPAVISMALLFAVRILGLW